MFRPIEEKDREIYLSMTRKFYDSDAVLSPVPTENFARTFDRLIQGSPFADAFIFEESGNAVGYALLARTWSQEAGGEVIWIEEIYLEPSARSKGYGSAFFRFLQEEYAPGAKRFRLEVEKENEGAVALYERLGFEFFPYDQMRKDRE
ncbi:MAG: GNAT family N-acetyltransferase [Clostridia bacterium]|nr:GNAT family N-acetyltransferase [Clostridia bacterium]